jgi:para-aminobenzoate synthetase
MSFSSTELTLGAGGAITHLSDAADEWEEVLVKTDAVLGKLPRST